MDRNILTFPVGIVGDRTDAVENLGLNLLRGTGEYDA
jgi:hypothetical protein